MLPSKDRLSFREVETVLKSGRRKPAALFSVSFLSPTERSAFAVTVSKKIAKNAPDRNKIRRRIYSAIAKIKKSIPSPVYIVFFPKKEALTTDFATLEKEIKDFLIRANILK